MPEYAVPVIDDPYVGKVFGNILDFYDNPSYNLRLTMVKPEFEANPSGPLVAPPSGIVILAQTGVTGTQSDDLEIDALVDSSLGTELKCRFTIIQPGAATFLDEIQYAKAYLGYDNSASTTMFLEIRFQGYTTDFDDNEEGGVPQVILGPIVYKIDLTEFSLSLDASGSVYDMQAIITDTVAYKDTVYRTPQTITSTGATITEHVESFVTALKEWHENTTSYEVSDKIEIDLSELIGASSNGSVGTSLSIISDDSLITSKDKGQAESVNRIMNETWDIRTKLEQQAALDADPIDSGTAPEIQFDGDNLSIKEGTSIAEYMYILLSMCPEFYTKCSRKENIDDPDSPVKKDQAFISWFKIDTRVERLEFDPSRNDYARKYTFVPLLFKTANPNVAVDIQELNPELSDLKERVKQYKESGSLLKAYGYFFTGVNDQILNLDIKYNNGTGSMLPPKYGAIGEVSQTSQNKLSDSTPAGEDTSFAGRLDSMLGKAKEKADKNVFGDFVDAVTSLQSGSEDILGSVANQLGSVLGLTDSEILTRMADRTGLNELVEQVNQEQRNLFGGLSINSPTLNTEPPEVASAGPGSGTYTPEPSGYVYSTDFVPAASDSAVDASTLAELGYIPGGSIPPLPNKADASKDVKSVAEAGTTQIGSTRNKLFGFITEQQNSVNFLLEIDLELRGDPWFLASQDLSKPTEAKANFKRDDSLFFLRIASPQKADPDWRDEDNNTGYWKFDGTSRTFSGVYKFQSCINKFSGGQFSVTTKAIRLHGLDEPATEIIAEETETDG